MAFDVSSLFRAGKSRLAAKVVREDLFADLPELRRQFFSVSDDVLLIGFPEGISHERAHLPIVRTGSLATILGEPLTDEVEGGRKRLIRGFLVDAAATPGMAGVP